MQALKDFAKNVSPDCLLTHVTYVTYVSVTQYMRALYFLSTYLSTAMVVNTNRRPNRPPLTIATPAHSMQHSTHTQPSSQITSIVQRPQDTQQHTQVSAGNASSDYEEEHENDVLPSPTGTSSPENPQKRRIEQVTAALQSPDAKRR